MGLNSMLKPIVSDQHDLASGHAGHQLGNTHCCGMGSHSSTSICNKSASVVVLVTEDSQSWYTKLAALKSNTKTWKHCLDHCTSIEVCCWQHSWHRCNCTAYDKTESARMPSALNKPWTLLAATPKHGIMTQSASLPLGQSILSVQAKVTSNLQPYI